MTRPILLAEDEETDVIFMRLALEAAQVSHPLQVVKDGRETVDYLGGTGKYRNRQAYPLPALLLLDLKLPQLLGLEVLRWVRLQPELTELPVIICSGSDQDSDVETAYALGAQGYVIKPGRPSELEHIVSLMKKYFLEAKGPPPGCREWLAVNVPKPTERLD